MHVQYGKVVEDSECVFVASGIRNLGVAMPARRQHPAADGHFKRLYSIARCKAGTDSTVYRTGPKGPGGFGSDHPSFHQVDGTCSP